MPSAPITEQAITAALRRLPSERWPQVLAFIDSLQSPQAAPGHFAPGRTWTAAELRKLPPAERDAILDRQAAALAEDYRNDAELTDFEAFSDEDQVVDGPGPEAG